MVAVACTVLELLYLFSANAEESNAAHLLKKSIYHVFTCSNKVLAQKLLCCT